MSNVNTVVEVAALSVRYGHTAVNAPVSFKLAAGEVGLLVGKNGAGKTSVLMALLGMVSYSADAVLVLGAPPPPWRPWEVANRRVATVTQAPVFPVDFSLAEVADVWAASVSKTAADPTDILSELRSKLKIDERVPIRELSYGQRRIAELLLALAARPRLLIADEPYAGVSHRLALLLRGRIDSYLEGGGAVLATAHGPEQHHWRPAWTCTVRSSQGRSNVG